MSNGSAICPYPDCGYPVYAKNLCERHYDQDRRGEELHPVKRRTPGGVCTVDGCGEKTKGLGLCAGHYTQYREGKPLTPLQRRDFDPEAVCIVPTCPELRFRGEYCSPHYQRNLKYGTPEPEEIICASCGKGLNRFGGLSDTPLCKDCKHRWREFHPEQNKVLRRRARAKIYGLTVEEMETLLARGRCDICGCESPRGRGDWHIDHDHKTGKVRGLLCLPCNQHIGYWKDDPNLLRAVIRYLQRAAKEQARDDRQQRLI